MFFWGYSGMRIHGIGNNCVLLGRILIPEQNWRNSGLFGIVIVFFWDLFWFHFEPILRTSTRVQRDCIVEIDMDITDQCLVYLLQCLSKVSVSYGKWTQKGAWQTNKQVKLVNMASGRSDSCKTPCTSWECSQSGGQNKRNVLFWELRSILM